MKEVNFHQINFGSVKWHEMFESEYELIQCLKSVDISEFKRNNYKGYEVIESLQKLILSGGELSKAQLTQLKRLSKEIYKYLTDGR